MSKVTQILLILASVVFLTIYLTVPETFQMLSKVLLFVIIGAAITVILGYIIYYGHRLYISIAFDREGVKQEKAKTTSMNLENQRTAIENEVYEEVIHRGLATEYLYTKKFGNVQFATIGSQAIPSLAALPEGDLDKGLPHRVDLDQYIGTDTCTLERIFMGVTYGGEPIYYPFSKMVHILVAGTTGGGKSVFLNNLLTQLICAKERVEVDLIDLASGTFDSFHLPFAEDIREAENVIRRWNDEFKRRRALYKQLTSSFDSEGIQSLDQYNHIADEPLPYSVLFIEEALGMTRDSSLIDTSIRNLVSQARKYGLVVVFVAQSVKAKVLDTEVRDNFRTRVVFTVQEPTLGRVVMPGFDFRALGDNDGRGVIEFHKQRSVVQTPWVDPKLMIEAGYIARDQDIAKTQPSKDPEVLGLTIDHQTEVIDLASFNEDNGLPVVPKDQGTTRERISLFFDICEDRGIDTLNLEDASILKNVHASLAGYNYDLVRQARS